MLEAWPHHRAAHDERKRTGKGIQVFRMPRKVKPWYLQGKHCSLRTQGQCCYAQKTRRGMFRPMKGLKLVQAHQQSPAHWQDVQRSACTHIHGERRQFTQAGSAKADALKSTHLAMLKAQAFQNTGPEPPFICSHSREEAANPAPASLLKTGNHYA